MAAAVNGILTVGALILDALAGELLDRRRSLFRDDLRDDRYRPRGR